MDELLSRYSDIESELYCLTNNIIRSSLSAEIDQLTEDNKYNSLKLVYREVKNNFILLKENLSAINISIFENKILLIKDRVFLCNLQETHSKILSFLDYYQSKISLCDSEEQDIISEILEKYRKKLTEYELDITPNSLKVNRVFTKLQKKMINTTIYISENELNLNIKQFNKAHNILNTLINKLDLFDSYNQKIFTSHLNSIKKECIYLPTKSQLNAIHSKINALFQAYPKLKEFDKTAVLDLKYSNKNLFILSYLKTQCLYLLAKSHINLVHREAMEQFSESLNKFHKDSMKKPLESINFNLLFTNFWEIICEIPGLKKYFSSLGFFVDIKQYGYDILIEILNSYNTSLLYIFSSLTTMADVVISDSWIDDLNIVIDHSAPRDAVIEILNNFYKLVVKHSSLYYIFDFELPNIYKTPNEDLLNTINSVELMECSSPKTYAGKNKSVIEILPKAKSIISEVAHSSERIRDSLHYTAIMERTKLIESYIEKNPEIDSEYYFKQLESFKEYIEIFEDKIEEMNPSSFLLFNLYNQIISQLNKITSDNYSELLPFILESLLFIIKVPNKQEKIYQLEYHFINQFIINRPSLLSELSLSRLENYTMNLEEIDIRDRERSEDGEESIEIQKESNIKSNQINHMYQIIQTCYSKISNYEDLKEEIISELHNAENEYQENMRSAVESLNNLVSKYPLLYQFTEEEIELNDRTVNYIEEIKVLVTDGDMLTLVENSSYTILPTYLYTQEYVRRTLSNLSTNLKELDRDIILPDAPMELESTGSIDVIDNQPIKAEKNYYHQYLMYFEALKQSYYLLEPNEQEAVSNEIEKMQDGFEQDYIEFGEYEKRTGSFNIYLNSQYPYFYNTIVEEQHFISKLLCSEYIAYIAKQVTLYSNDGAIQLNLLLLKYSKLKETTNMDCEEFIDEIETVINQKYKEMINDLLSISNEINNTNQSRCSVVKMINQLRYTCRTYFPNHFIPILEFITKYDLNIKAIIDKSTSEYNGYKKEIVEFLKPSYISVYHKYINLFGCDEIKLQSISSRTSSRSSVKHSINGSISGRSSRKQSINKAESISRNNSDRIMNIVNEFRAKEMVKKKLLKSVDDVEYTPTENQKFVDFLYDISIRGLLFYKSTKSEDNEKLFIGLSLIVFDYFLKSLNTYSDEAFKEYKDSILDTLKTKFIDVYGKIVEDESYRLPNFFKKINVIHLLRGLRKRTPALEERARKQLEEKFLTIEKTIFRKYNEENSFYSSIVFNLDSFVMKYSPLFYEKNKSLFSKYSK